MQRITPRVNLVFKKLFGVEENKDLLISLINATVSQEDQVVDVTLLNPYNTKGDFSLIDIKAQGACGKMFNIEIQITDERDYDKHALDEWAKLHTEQLRAMQAYSKPEKVIGIHVLNFISIVGSDEYYNFFRITKEEIALPSLDCMDLYTIELSKFVDIVGDEVGELEDKIQTPLDMWSALLTRYEDLRKLKILPNSLDNPALKKAIDVLDRMYFTDQEWEMYEGRIKWLRMQASAVKKIEETGKKKGMAFGEEKGRKKEKQEIAHQMLQEP